MGVEWHSHRLLIADPQSATRELELDRS